MKQTIVFIFLLLISELSFGQFEKLSGNWISDKNEMISIQDSVKSNNYITNSKSRNDNFYLEILGDTISLQSRYYTSEDDFEKMITDRYDFKILEITDSTFTAKPITKFSKNFFLTDTSITFLNQNYITNPNFKLEKLVFRTSTCNGSCPVINLRITSDRDLDLNATYYKNSVYQKDKTKSGNFIAKLDEKTYRELRKLLIQAKIDTFDIIPSPMELCCDGAVKTIITYHNGKRNYIKTMHEPRILRELISYLYNLPEIVDLERTEREFIFEK